MSNQNKGCHDGLSSPMPSSSSAIHTPKAPSSDPPNVASCRHFEVDYDANEWTNLHPPKSSSRWVMPPLAAFSAPTAASKPPRPSPGSIASMDAAGEEVSCIAEMVAMILIGEMILIGSGGHIFSPFVA